MSQQLTGSSPWGLPRELLQHVRIVQDPVRPIYLSRLENLLTDWPLVQRLGRVQLNTAADAAYPNDTAPRLAHSLGSVSALEWLLGHLGPHHPWQAEHQLFTEWGSQRELHWLQAVVLGRLEALLHDVLHLPYSHWLEDVYRLLDRHDEAAGRFEIVWSALPGYLDEMVQRDRITEVQRAALQTIVDGPLAICLRGSILSGVDTGIPEWYPWVSDLVNRFPGADAADYLCRDNVNAGRPFAFDERWVRALTVVPRSHAVYPGRVAFRIARGGRPRPEVAVSILRMLADRLDAFKFLYRHRRVLQRVAMVAKAVHGWLEHRCDILGDEALARADIERVLLARGDEGLLLHLAQLWERESEACQSPEARTRLANVSVIAEEVLAGPSRYWLEAASCEDLSAAQSMAQRFTSPAQRASLEARLAKDAGAELGEIVLLIPPPTMKAKNSGSILLVEGDEVIPASESVWAEDFRQVQAHHEETWRAQLFIRPRVGADRARLVEALTTHTQAHWTVTE